MNSSRQQRRQNGRARSAGRRRTSLIGGAAAATLIAGGLVYFLTRQTGPSGPVQFPDVHGIGFSSDGRQLVVAVHDGLRIFEEGEWRAPQGIPHNDYMGYSPVNEGFYSSGHPGSSVDRVNPFGLVKSTDGGRTLTALGFEGESDFHVMAAGYQNHVIYVLNQRPNSRLPVGLHFSLNQGQSWEHSAAQGVAGDIIQMAAHPTDASVVAVAAEGGLFLSSDYGNAFEQIGDDAPITAAAFDPQGTSLLFGFSKLSRYDLEGHEIELLQIPDIGGDGIGYIAINPVTNEIAFATFRKDVFLSRDNGRSWEHIVEDGAG